MNRQQHSRSRAEGYNIRLLLRRGIFDGIPVTWLVFVLNVGHVAHGEGSDTILDAAVKVRNVKNNKAIFNAVATEHSGQWLKLDITRARATPFSSFGIFIPIVVQ
jgi:hypothetical protein